MLWLLAILLTVIMFACKLLGLGALSWLIVFAPIMAMMLFSAVLLLIAIVCLLIADSIN